MMGILDGGGVPFRLRLGSFHHQHRFDVVDDHLGGDD